MNLADLYRQTGHDADGEASLRAALVVSPKDAGLHYALGLALIRLKRPEDALGELRQAAKLAPENAQNSYVYAVALNSVGRSAEARQVLRRRLAPMPTTAKS